MPDHTRMLLPQYMYWITGTEVQRPLLPLANSVKLYHASVHLPYYTCRLENSYEAMEKLVSFENLPAKRRQWWLSWLGICFYRPYVHHSYYSRVIWMMSKIFLQVRSTIFFAYFAENAQLLATLAGVQGLTRLTELPVFPRTFFGWLVVFIVYFRYIFV